MYRQIMALAGSDLTYISIVESNLEQEREPVRRLALINQLSSYYVFTNIERTRRLLQEEDSILSRSESAPRSPNYYIHRALLENQAYRYDLAEKYFQEAIQLVDEVGDAR
ncbi:MAG: hypothetical protein ACKOA4_03585, partial [Haliscomenobacter sp.]